MSTPAENLPSGVTSAQYVPAQPGPGRRDSLPIDEHTRALLEWSARALCYHTGRYYDHVAIARMAVDVLADLVHESLGYDPKFDTVSFTRETLDGYIEGKGCPFKAPRALPHWRDESFSQPIPPFSELQELGRLRKRFTPKPMNAEQRDALQSAMAEISGEDQ